VVREGYINHWDHKQAGLLALTAVMPDAPSRPMFPELLDEGLEPFEVPNLWLAMNEADTYVDITETLDAKLASLAEHVSSTPREQRASSGNEPKLGAQSGSGYTYAEGFKAFHLLDEDEDEEA
jgi:Uncharacterized proteins, LmbE homologs